MPATAGARSRQSQKADHKLKARRARRGKAKAAKLRAAKAKRLKQEAAATEAKSRPGLKAAAPSAGREEAAAARPETRLHDEPTTDDEAALSPWSHERVARVWSYAANDASHGVHPIGAREYALRGGAA